MMQLKSLVPLWVLVATVASAYTPCDNCTDRATTNQLSNISLQLYMYNNVSQYVSVLVGDVLNLYDLLDARKPTVLYISGWTESPESTSVKTVVQAYLTRNDHNVLILDWSEIAAYEWLYAVRSADGIGYTVAISLNKLVAAGLDGTKIHVVGYSLGGQIAGFIGNYVNCTLSRITGLDPAGLNNTFTIAEEHLSSTDATFVDVIHTNPGIVGVNYTTGSSDFWVNGLTGLQPGCENSTEPYCDHARAWHFYAESLLDEHSFVAVACDSYNSFENGTCGCGSSTTSVIMGYATPNTARGNFYLQTNSASPFGRGVEGCTYDAYIEFRFKRNV